MYREIILSKLFKYLELKKWKFKKSGKIVMLLCPTCKKEPFTANIIPQTSTINCFTCKKKYNLLDIAKIIEPKFPEKEEDQLQYLKNLLKIDVKTSKDEQQITKVLEFYEKNGFDLVPVAKNAKNPIEKDWVNKSHKNKDEWFNWVSNDLNVGVKTGVKSNITVIDIDTNQIPEELLKLLGNTLIQKTNKGWHYIYKYEKELPKTRIECLSGQTKIRTSKGNKILSSIKKGDKLLSYNFKQSKIEETKVINIWKQIKNKKLKLTFGDKTIESGENHLFYVINKGLKKAKELKIDEEVYYVSTNSRQIIRAEGNNNINCYPLGYILGYIFKPAIQRKYPDWIKHYKYLHNGKKLIKKEVMNRKKIGKGFSMYDLTVSKNGNFFANDILVHNCYKIDIENDGGQIVCEPSIVEDKKRSMNFDTVSAMSKELKEYLKSKILMPSKTSSEKLREDIQTENFKINPEEFKLKNNNLDGCCNSSFIKLGGILRKNLNLKETEFVLNVLNKHLLERPMSYQAIKGMIRALDKYIQIDEEELAMKVLEYLKMVDSPRNVNDISNTIMGTNRGEDKKRIEKVLNYLLKEEKIIKKGRTSYEIIKDMNWTDTLLDVGVPVDFKVPYFYDYAYFNKKDLIVIGSQNKYGKTSLSMNIVKRLVEQGIKPNYIFNECFDKDTEILTDQGWKYFKDLDKTEKVVTLNPKNSEIEYQKPINYYKYNYKGAMLSLKNRYLDLLITPNHKQPMIVRGTNKIKFYIATKMPKYNKILITGKWKGINPIYFYLKDKKRFPGSKKGEWSTGKGQWKKYTYKFLMKDWLSFLGMYLAKGSIDNTRICITQNTKINEVEKIIKKLNISYTYCKDSFRFHHPAISRYLKKFGNSASNKKMPKFIKDLSPDLIRIFLDSYCLGDGTITKTGNKIYATTSKELANDVQELILKINKVATINIRQAKGFIFGYKRKHDLHLISEINNLSAITVKNRKWIKYDGIIYDVQVPKYHILMVRRNGKISWSGNSGGRYGKVALKLGMKEGDFWRVYCGDPEQVILKPNAITIYDWVRPMGDEYAKTAQIFNNFIEQLEKTKGFMICFVQLKKNDDFFAPNMIGQFPALLAKYLYRKDDGTETTFEICDVRDSKIRKKHFNIDCIYDWQSREVKRLDELNKEE